MSLGCNLKEIKENAFSGVQELVKTKTISMNRDGLIHFDYTKSKNYKTKEAAYNVALNVQNKIKDFMSEQLGQEFSRGWTQLIENNNEISLQYNFPKYVQTSLNRKFEIEEGREIIEFEIEQARQQQIEDAKRAGIDESEFDNNYMYFQYQEDFDDFMDPDVQYKKDNSIPNDFSSYISHKKNLLKKLEEKFDSYKILNKANYGSDKYKADSYSFQNTINKLKDELENLNPDSADIMFQDIINEMNYLNDLLDTSNTEILGNQDVINRIDFLNQMITGQNLNGEVVNYEIWNGNTFPDYDKKILAPMSSLDTKLKFKANSIIKDALSKDILFQANKDNFTEEEIQSLFEKRSDINILQDLFLGINSNNDTISATLLNTTFQTNVQKTKQYARPLVEDIRKLDKKLKDANFDTNDFFETDNVGIDTGNIIHKYTRNYFRKLYNYYQLNRDFNQAKKENKATAYAKKIAWLKENTTVIDFRKIKHFKDLYEGEYNDFFTATDSEMLAYEDLLKQTLGKLYNFHIQDLEKKLAEYEDYKMNEELKNTKWIGKNINSNSPWSFIQNYYSSNPNEQIEYQSGNNTYFTYNNSKFIEFVPNKYAIDPNTFETIDSGNYNQKFDAIENNEDAFAYWENMREIYSKHINPTYASMGQNISAMSWAKFERGFAEEISASKGLMGFLKTTYNQAIKAFKDAWYERGYYTDKNNIKSNYTDATNKEINKMKKFLSLKNIEDIQKMATDENIEYQDLNKLIKDLKENDKNIVTTLFKDDLIDKISRKKVFAEYSKDLTKSTLALSELATLHKARQETQFIADLLLSYHKTIKDNKGKDRNTSNKKLQSWVSTNIYNNRAVSRGNVEDGLGNDIKRLPKLYSEVEKQLLTILKGLKNDSTDNVKNYSFFKDNVNYSKKGNDFYETIQGKPNKITKEGFEKAMEEYLDAEIQNLGIYANPGSIGLGIMKIIINKALALNLISGIFNRVDGMFANSIRDNMGDYWTSGNLKFAKRFMALANINKFSGDKMSLQSKQKSLQMKTYQFLLDELSLFQDKKNELDRKDKESKFDSYKEKLNMFQFAVDNPEFKNQGEIVLSMLMDVRIKDNNGKEYKFFDGSGFPIYKPGTIELRDEFNNEENKGWQNFNINTENPQFNQFFVSKLKIEDTIKRTQGNYASLDSIRILDSNWGKFMMLFMRWMPEHINQRFGTRSVDIIQGKSKIAGRYRGMLRNTGATSIFASVALGIGLGPVGIGVGLTVGTILPFVMQKWGKKYVNANNDIKNHLLDMNITLGFMKEIIIQSINLPLKVGYGKTNLDTIIKNNRLNANPNLSQDEANALKGMAQESAIMITQLTVLLLLKSLLWDNDDEDDDYRRQLHNFVDNQANRSIGNMLNWSNPKTFIEENSKLAMLRYIGDVEKLVKHVNDYFVKDKGGVNDLLYDFTKIQPFVAIPNSIAKGTFKGEYPGLDNKEYKGNQWFDHYVKGDEENNKKKLINTRSKFKEEYEELLRQKYEGKEIDEDELERTIEKQVKKRMQKKDIQKRKGETATEALDRIDFDKEIEEDRNR